MWIKIDNHKTKVRIGVIYCPQESRTKKEDLMKIYERLEQQVLMARVNDESMVITGDFNGKIDMKKDGKISQSTMAGKILQKFARTNNLRFLNKNEKTEGFWTRSEGEKNSVIDYALVDRTSEEKVVKTIIDEQKLWTPYYVKEKRAIYSDHNAIIIEMNWRYQQNKEPSKKVIKFEKNTKEEYYTETNGNKLKSIISKRKPLNNRYKEWEKMIKVKANKTFQKRRKNKFTGLNKTIKQLMQRRREVKRKPMNIKTSNIREERLKLITEHIENEQHALSLKKSTYLVNKIIHSGGINNPNFWSILKCKESTDQVRTVMKTKDGLVKEEKASILEIYKEHYCDLLKNKEPENEKEQIAQENVNQTFKVIKEIANKTKSLKLIEKEEIEKAIQKLKANKAGDLGGMRNEFIMYAGEDLKESLQSLLNEIMQSGEIPNKWENMKIKSIFKNKGDNKLMKNQRGLFITSIVSKIFERILLERNKEIISKSLSSFQCGGQEQRGTIDHLFTFRAIQDEYRYKKKNLYIFYGDLEKCFDKLWLKDCMVDLWKAGVSAQEVMLVYNMNKKASITVDTPYGMTTEFIAQEVVRQGTIWGPTLCANSTDKINKIGKRVQTRYENIVVEPLLFMDDICGMGDQEEAEELVKNCRKMEEEKMMTFNNDKSNFQIVSFAKKNNKNSNEPKGAVKKGNIKTCSTYNYLGEVINCKGTVEEAIDKKESKVGGIIASIIKHAIKTGTMYGNVALKLLKTTFMPYVLYGTETWTNMRKKDKDDIERLQRKAVTQIFQQKATTPYLALISELGIWPIGKQVEYKKLMLYHALVNSDDKRISKKILEQQIEKEKEQCWYSEIKDLCVRLGLTEVEEKLKKSKTIWKNIIKKQINEELERELLTAGKKSRFATSYKEKQYVKELPWYETKYILQIKTNMIDLKENYKNGKSNLLCPVCEKSNDTTEHLFTCDGKNKLKKKCDINVKVEDLKSEDPIVLRSVMGFVESMMELRGL